MTCSFAATAAAVLALAVVVPAGAQGKGKGPHGNPPGNSPLPSPLVAAPATEGTVPFAWIDDASMLPPGTMALSVSAMRWQRTDLSEVDVPVVGVSLGLAPRVQLGASIPRVVGDDTSGVVGGVGTSYVSVKVGVPTGRASMVKLTVAPTVQILGEGALQALASGDGRTQFGLPVSLEIDRGAVRLFGSTGFFTQGVWFAGGGIGAQVATRVAVSVAFSRAWTTDATGSVAGDRRELSGSVALSLRSQMALFGSVGRSVATADRDGAGTTVTGGIVIVLTPAVLK